MDEKMEDEDKDNKDMEEEDEGVNIHNNSISATTDDAWTQSFLRECKRGARQTALALVKACGQSKEDRDSLRETAIQMIQELQEAVVMAAAAAAQTQQPQQQQQQETITLLLEQARSFQSPYHYYYEYSSSSSVNIAAADASSPHCSKPFEYYNAEDGENIFHVWQSLLGHQPPDLDPSLKNNNTNIIINNNNNNNQANRSARCLWRHDPSHADQLLWAKQAWEHPEIDGQVVSSSSSPSPSPSSPSSTSTSSSRRRSFSSSSSSSSCNQQKKQLLMLHWNKQDLTATSATALALPPSNTTTTTTTTTTATVEPRNLSNWIQKWCEPFQVTTEEWILLLPASDFFFSFNTTTTAAAVVQEQEQQQQQPQNPDPSPQPAVDPAGRNASSSSSSSSSNSKRRKRTTTTTTTTSPTSLLYQIANARWDWLLLKLCEALTEWRLDSMFPTLMHPNVHKHWKPPPPPQQQQRLRNNDDDDDDDDDNHDNDNDKDHHNFVIVMQCLLFVARVHCAMKVLKREALESKTLLTKILRCCHLLQHHAAQTVYRNMDWKKELLLLLSSYSSSNRPDPKNGNFDSSVRRPKDSAGGGTAVGVSQSQDVSTTVIETAEHHQPSASESSSWIHSIPMDPRVEKVLAEAPPGQSAAKTVLDQPVEKLDSVSGSVLETFSTGHLASKALGLKRKSFLVFALQGRNYSTNTRKLFGHVYKGAFWRLKGSNAEPTTLQATSAAAVSSAGRNPDPFAAQLRHKGWTKTKILEQHEVEQVDLQTGEVLKTFPNGLEALKSQSDSKSTNNFYAALQGKRMNCGHVWKKHFWRLKGSKANPKATTVSEMSLDAAAPEESARAPRPTTEDNADLKRKYTDLEEDSDDDGSVASNDGLSRKRPKRLQEPETPRQTKQDEASKTVSTQRVDIPVDTPSSDHLIGDDDEDDGWYECADV